MRPTSRLGWRSSRLHSCDGPLGWLELALVEQLQRPDDALAVVGVDLRGRPRRAFGEECVQGSRPAALELGLPALAHPLRRRRAQVELGERGAEVQAGAPDHDRAAPGGEQVVDLGVCELGVLAGAEGGVQRHQRQQPVLEQRPLGRRGGARQGLQAGVHLQGVGGDRDRVLAAGPQQLGEGHRDGGLADARSGRTARSRASL